MVPQTVDSRKRLGLNCSTVRKWPFDSAASGTLVPRGRQLGRAQPRLQLRIKGLRPCPHDRSKGLASKPMHLATAMSCTSSNLPAPHILDVCRSDVDTLERVVELSRLNQYSAESLMTAFIEAGDSDGTLSIEAFDRVLRALVPSSRLSESEKRVAVCCGFRTCFTPTTGTLRTRVDVADFVCGMSVLASGGKSDKLALSFGLFDSGNDASQSAGNVEVPSVVFDHFARTGGAHRTESCVPGVEQHRRVGA